MDIKKYLPFITKDAVIDMDGGLYYPWGNIPAPRVQRWVNSQGFDEYGHFLLNEEGEEVGEKEKPTYLLLYVIEEYKGVRKEIAELKKIYYKEE